VTFSISSKPFGRLSDGRAASLFTLTNKHGAYVQFTNFGVALVKAQMPDGQGRLGPVVLGFDTLAQYESNSAYIGVVIGPVSNRIEAARFTIDGTVHAVDANEGPTCLHSGAEGWHKKLWNAELTAQGLRFTHKTAKNAGGFPGIVQAQIDVSFDDNHRLTYDMQAQTSAATPIAMTRHEYFNLTDGGASPIDEHNVQLNSASYAALAANNTANGNVALIADIGLELQTPQPLKKFKTADGHLQFDHHYIVQGDGLRHMARVQSPASGRQLDVFATSDGLQFYTGQSMPLCKGAKNIAYGPSHGFALEPQARPNAVTHPHFPSIILRPGETYEDRIIYHFGLID